MCLGRKVVVAMLDWSRERPDYQRYAALFLLAYTFLLRVPSEAIPTVAGGVADQSSQAILALEGDALHLRLRRRKNKPHGSSLRRHCWCETCPKSCPVHVLAKLLDGCVPGAELFRGISAQGASKALRHMLYSVGVRDVGAYRLHNLRRGHAKDLQLAGKSVSRLVYALCASLAYRKRTVADPRGRGMAQPGLPGLHGPKQTRRGSGPQVPHG